MSEGTMPPPTCEIDTVGIVLVGSFNPAIFQPRWLGQQSLVARGEAEEANIELIHPDRTSFEVGKWLKVQVLHDRFEAGTSAGRALALQDFVAGLFGILEHTPVTIVGFNRLMHFRVQDQKARDAIGYRLAPPAAWPTTFHGSKMLSLRMQEQRATGEKARTITVEPSFVIKDTGVFVMANEQFPIPPAPSDSALQALQLIQGEFQKSIQAGRELAEEIVGFGGQRA